MIAIELKQAALREDRVPFELVVKDVEKLGKLAEEDKISTYLIYTCYISNEEFERRKNVLAELSGKFDHKPNIIMFNLNEIPEHGDWKLSMENHISKIREIYGKGAG